MYSKSNNNLNKYITSEKRKSLKKVISDKKNYSKDFYKPQLDKSLELKQQNIKKRKSKQRFLSFDKKIAEKKYQSRIFDESNELYLYSNYYKEKFKKKKNK